MSSPPPPPPPPAPPYPEKSEYLSKEEEDHLRLLLRVFLPPPPPCAGVVPPEEEKRLCTFLLAMMHFLEVSFGKNHIFVPKSVEFSARIRADFDVFVAGIAKLKEEKDAQSSKFAVRHLKCIFFRKATEGELFLSSPFFSPASENWGI